MIKLSLIATVLMFLSSASADWVYVRPEVGLGFSDNVYQDDLFKKSDVFTWLQFSTKYGLSDSDLTAKINATLYSTESSNNSVSYSVRRKSELDFAKLGLTMTLGGFNYLKNEIGSTDESYNNFYFLSYLTKNIVNRENFDLTAEPGFKITTYPKLSGRNDVTLFARLDAIWSMRTDAELNPYFELGFLFSNQAYYTKNYIDIGALWSEKLSAEYKYNVDFFLRSSSYPNRRVVDILGTPNRTGRGTGTRLEANENISLMQLSGAFIRTDDSRELSLGASIASENSLSRLEYYNEVQLLASALWTF